MKKISSDGITNTIDISGTNAHLSRTTTSCIICGCKTADIATVYIGQQIRGTDNKPHVKWVPYEKPLCHKCAEDHHDSDKFHILLYVAFQVCWASLATHGLSVIGIGGAAIACYGIYKLIQAAADMIWRHTHRKALLTEEPLWMNIRSSPEEIASNCLKDEVKADFSKKGYLIESLHDYHRHK